MRRAKTRHICFEEIIYEENEVAITDYDLSIISVT